MTSTQEIFRTLEDIQFENTFNPYFERCPVYDAQDAPELRRRYLAEMLDRAADAELDAIWVGRDLGYRGGRRTGLALTDDVHFADHLERWGLDAQRPTFGKPIAERTAAAIWDVLLRVNVPVFLWNVFPLHPFIEGDPFSNRAHNAKERRVGVELLIKMVNYLQPKRIIAIGNDAYNVLSGVFTEDFIYKARHPSYGGKNEFLSAMQSLYATQMAEREPCLFGQMPEADSSSR
ncbi:uracil-DNA glycosylase [Aquicoccus porphyridii]|uniref:Uracil-DNA glycosylase n=1 Tax=Aquicoccus porphyridii TaxID=1852029 RepID=A0A5A9ZCE7_9RHOB|nr:uracil-DNA glycosylase [Aquicoccus porphyridii]KAA0914893.1 uracil-DNA glycosylase [Aquicoccus porphyridii]RAI52563.1 uracil-DNA glycosylase [Rhodobacteraceae bacterium AsT-22]